MAMSDINIYYVHICCVTDKLFSFIDTTDPPVLVKVVLNRFSRVFPKRKIILSLHLPPPSLIV